jgi:hypothetical protein
VHKARRLEDLGRRSHLRAQRLRGAGQLLGPPLDPRERATASFLVLEAVTLWANFARSYYLSCALGTKSPDGGRLELGVPFFANEDAALRFAASGERTRSRGEPVWHDFNAFGRVMTRLNPVDPTRLLTGLGYTSTVFRDLTPCRNFFAHRTRTTATKVKTVARRNGVNPDLPASDVVCSHASGRSDGLIVEWLDDLTAIIDILAAS